MLYLNILKTEEMLRFWDKKFSAVRNTSLCFWTRRYWYHWTEIIQKW